MDEYWTLDQALGWIRWRDLSIVKRLKSETYGVMLLWPPSEQGFGTPEQLLKELRGRKISASGQRNGIDDRANISHRQWSDLRFAFGRSAAIAEPHEGTSGAFWANIKIPAHELQDYFRDDPSKSPKKKRKGQVSIDDSKIVIKMHNLLASGEAKSTNAAAVMLADSASGQSKDAIIRRLKRKYSEIYGS